MHASEEAGRELVVAAIGMAFAKIRKSRDGPTGGSPCNHIFGRACAASEPPRFCPRPIVFISVDAAQPKADIPNFRLGPKNRRTT